MLEQLIKFDQRLFLTLNNKGTETLDPIMVQLSAVWIWIPVLALAGFILIRRNPKRGLMELGFIIITLIVTDLISAQVIKELVQRLRPCHDPELVDRVRLVAKSCGGKFGFVSSHASNAFGIAILSSLLIRQTWFIFLVLLWAILVSYSRIYLGVHYPGDILGGILLGITASFLFYRLVSKLLKIRLFYEPES